MPTISVIVPVYKVEKYIHRCVDSILRQSYTDFELILVNDGSPDNCGDICDEYAAKDARVVVIHQENGGLSAARNAGIDWAFSKSNSQWLTFIDSDDWVHPDYLKLLLDAAIENDVEVSVCGYAETDGKEPDVSQDMFTSKLWETEEFYVEQNVNATVAWGKLYRKACFKSIRYPVGKIHEDEFTTYKILFACKQIVALPAKLYYYFYNQEGITKSQWNEKRIDALFAFREQVRFFKKNGFSRAYKQQIGSLVYGSLFQLKSAEELDVHMTNATVKVKKMLKIGLRYARQNDMFSFAENKWIYEKAYPTYMWFYWTITAIYNKIKRK